MISLYELEEKYKDTLESIEEWVYLRVALGHQLKHNDKNQISEQSYKFQKLLNKIEKLKNIFYGLQNWFRKYDYICFSDSSERRLIDGIYKDKIMDDIIDRLSSKSLLIELPNQDHYKNVYTKYITSQSPLDLIIFILKKLFSFTAFSNENINNFLRKEDIEFDYRKIISLVKIETKLYKLLFFIYKPKAIFINCAYCRFGVVKAAKDLGIKVIEVQHGVITNVHFGYISTIRLNNSFLPKKLLSFGENEYKIKNLLIKKVIPIGSYYLEYLSKNFKPDKELLSKINNYKYVIGISLQDADWEYYGMLDFIEKVAKKDKDILYILIPRRRKDSIKLSDNVILYDKIDCYNIILHCHIHATLYSSCVLEAPTLGIPNILVDIDSFATKYYKNVLDNYHTKIIKNENDFIELIPKMVNLDQKIIKEKNKNIFVTNYEKRINDFILNEDLI